MLAAGLASIALAYLVIGGALPTPRQDVVPGAPSPSTSAPATTLPGLVTEEVEPGVLRIIRDDAGHDLDARHPDWRLDLDGMAITPDGTVWIRSTYHDTDNAVGMPRAPLVWALGQPGVLGVADGIPSSVRGLVPLPDSSILAVGDRVAHVTGSSVTPDTGPPVRQVHGGWLWLVEPGARAAIAAGDRPEGRLEVLWVDGAWLSLSELGRSASSPSDWCQATQQGIACLDRLHLRGTNINQLALAPDGAIWAVGALDGEGGGLYRISPQ
jgi:hypothetical protein